MKIGLMGAMREEIDSVTGDMRVERVVESGSRTYHVGTLGGHEVVVAFSRWGKVAAATTATSLLVQHGVDALLFTGVAGGVDPALRVGDVVVGTRFTQHDMDARPLFRRHEIPLLGAEGLGSDDALSARLLAASERFVARIDDHIDAATRQVFGIERPRVVSGEIASGDRFFASHTDVVELRERLPAVCCVEMEGAAVAQVCHEHGVPFAVVRTVSDAADAHAPVDFVRFLHSVASVYSRGILAEFFGGE